MRTTASYASFQARAAAGVFAGQRPETPGGLRSRLVDAALEAAQDAAKAEVAGPARVSGG